MSLQDTYGFNKKNHINGAFGRLQFRPQMLGELHQRILSTKRTNLAKWHRKNHDTSSKLTCFFQSTLLHLQGYRDIFWLILVCFVPSFQVSWHFVTDWTVIPSFSKCLFSSPAKSADGSVLPSTDRSQSPGALSLPGTSRGVRET